MIGLVQNPPEYLYKYRCWDENHPYDKRILTDDEIFFASPMRFNDPFDCTVPLRYDKLTEPEWIKIYTAQIRKIKPYMNREEFRQSVKSFKKTKPYQRIGLIMDSQAEIQEIRYQKFGIFSLSSVSDNLLMWSHYCNSHEGYCIGFRAQLLNTYFNELFQARKISILPFKVEYTSSYPEIIPHPQDPENFIFAQIVFKAIDWSYENEYRYVLNMDTDKVFKISQDVIGKVILGCRMPKASIDEIRNILSKKSGTIDLYKAEMKSGEFGLDFTRKY